MSQDNTPNKPVHLIYLCGAIVLFFLLLWTGEWIVGFFTKSPNEFLITAAAAVVALGACVYFYKDEKTFTLVNEVSNELKKVHWPGPKEVKMATIVVVIMTFVSAVILGVFDAVWAKVTHLIYG